MKYLSAIAPSAGLAKLLCGAALLCIVANASADQLLVTGANRDGNEVYDLGIAASSTSPSIPLIGAPTLVNSAQDAATHGAFDALAWVPNSYCHSLDLIVADASKGQILRYAGASTQATCYKPTNGSPTVSPTAQVIFKWTKLGSGPAQPNGLSADANGNVFVVSSSGSWDPKPSVWVLPFNASASQYCSGAAGAAGGYCAPVLIDGKFGGTLTLALAETLVASTSAVTSTKTVLWNAGDLLVLVGDSFDARLMVYSQSKLYNSTGKNKGLLATSTMPLNAPSSTPIPWVKFLGELAAPFGMDLWPANSTLHTNPSVLFTTIDGRILSFDTVQNKFVTDFADRLGIGLQKIKVGTYANVPYAFVAQLLAKNTGQILEFGAPSAPPASGPVSNKPLATVTHGVMNPMGLAITNSGSQSVPAGSSGSTPCSLTPCVFAPLGPELVSTVNAAPGDQLSGTVLEQNCIVQSDPRVTTTPTGIPWSCTGAPLQIGAGTSYCPSFPTTYIPGSVCGHSGPSGAGFAVIEGTATGIDPKLNNSFVTTVATVDAVLPGVANLECANFSSENPAQFPGQIPLIAWGTRSDLPTLEGTIPEDSQFGSPLGGLPGYLTELTGGCDSSSTGSRELSIFAFGLGLSDTSQTYVTTLQNQKYEALQDTVAGAKFLDGPPSTVQSTLTSDIMAAETYVGNSNINCALSEIVATDTYLRANLSALASNLVMTGMGGGNENPAGDIDGRLANWYTVLNTMLAGNVPYAVWPPSSVPACITSTQPQIVSFAEESAGGTNENVNWYSVNTNTCTLTDLYAFNYADTGYNFYSAQEPTGGPGFGGANIYYQVNGTEQETSIPQFYAPGWGTDTYTLTCYGAPGTVPATASILNYTGWPDPPPKQLIITNFAADSPNGYVGYLTWTTENSTPAGEGYAGTTCTITDEFGGPPYFQSPTGNLPANVNLPESGTPPYEQYPYAFGAAFCPVPPNPSDPTSVAPPAQNTDTITLTCSDAYNGTAISTLTITNPGCDD